MNRDAYQRLVDENRVWLAKQPATLERSHIDLIINQSVDYTYGVAERLFKAIEHGDEQHRAWLKAKLEEFFLPPASNA